jgi:hypothetical protein
MAITHEEMRKWVGAEYPYDHAECGICATLHGACDLRDHAQMRKAARKLPNPWALRTTEKLFRAAMLRFRKKWAKFYPAR